MEQTPTGVLQAAANWAWLIPEVRFGHVVYVGPSDSSVPGSLHLLFDRVTELSGKGLAPVMNGAIGPVDVAYLDLAFMARAGLRLGPLVPTLRRVLGGGGHLCLASGCESGSLRARMRALWRLRVAARRAGLGGFRDFHRYYAHPDLRAPRVFLPGCGRLAAAVEQMSEPAPNRTVRLVMARCGLHGLLYRGHLGLCSA